MTCDERHYNIVRFYKRSYRKSTVRQRVTLAEAQAWCSDPETSSSTAKSAAARRRTKLVGDWFDGYEER